MISRYFKCNEKANELLETLPSVNILQVFPDPNEPRKCFFEISNSKESKAYVRVGKDKVSISSEEFDKKAMEYHNHVFRIRYFITDNIKLDKFINGLIRMKIMYNEDEDSTILPEKLAKFIEEDVTGSDKYYSINFLRTAQV